MLYFEDVDAGDILYGKNSVPLQCFMFGNKSQPVHGEWGAGLHAEECWSHGLVSPTHLSSLLFMTGDLQGFSARWDLTCRLGSAAEPRPDWLQPSSHEWQERKERKFSAVTTARFRVNAGVKARLGCVSNARKRKKKRLERSTVFELWEGKGGLPLLLLPLTITILEQRLPKPQTALIKETVSSCDTAAHLTLQHHSLVVFSVVTWPWTPTPTLLPTGQCALLWIGLLVGDNATLINSI